MINDIKQFSEIFLNPIKKKELLKYIIPISLISSIIINVFVGLVLYFFSDTSIPSIESFTGFIIYTILIAFIFSHPIHENFVAKKVKKMLNSVASMNNEEFITKVQKQELSNIIYIEKKKYANPKKYFLIQDNKDNLYKVSNNNNILKDSQVNGYFGKIKFYNLSDFN